MTTPEVGALAPDFTLPGITMVDGQPAKAHFTLSERRGHPVVLAFYPADNSLGCTAQLCSYEDELDSFRELGADVWGISRQNAKSHEKFARSKRLGFPLLSDEKGDAASIYGVGLMGLGIRRSIFIIDENGLLAWKHVSLLGMTFQTATTLKRELAKL
jgi:thioredoxin-dependent peroxiredoxin